MWKDVPEIYQRKILNGTMTEEDWIADWDIPPVAKRNVIDVVSDMLNDIATTTTIPVAKTRHLHVFRKDYERCMLKGCDATNPGFPKKMVGN